MIKTNDWFITTKPDKNCYVRLFCFHYGGGSASAYREWAKDLIDHVELVAIQLPGRESRFGEPLLNNVFEVVDMLYNNINGYLAKPFILFGHSIGALIAFEFIRMLRQNGAPQPKHLIVSGTKAPQVPLKRPIIHNLPDLQLIEELRKYNGVPSYILEDKELISIFLPIIRADFSISETYQYNAQEILNCPITALGGLSDDTFDSADLLKWQEQTNSSFQYYLLQGDHFFIRSSYQEVMKTINSVLYEEVSKFITIN